MSEEKKDSKYFKQMNEEDIKTNMKAFKKALKLSGFPNPNLDHDTVSGAVLIGEGGTHVPMDAIPVHADILEVSRENPLFEQLNFPSLQKLEKYIDEHREHLQKMQGRQLEGFLSALRKESLDNQLAIVNSVISKAGARKDGKKLAGDELTEWDNLFEKRMEKVRREIKDELQKQKDATVRTGDKETLPDPGEIAKKFYERPNNTRKKYEAGEIAPVMELIREYISENRIKNIDGHVNGIVDTKRFKGSKNAQRKWIKFYALHALKPDEA